MLIFLLTTIFLPLLAAFSLHLFPLHYQERLSVIFLGLALASCVFLVPSVLWQGKVFSWELRLGDFFSLNFLGDGLAVFMSLVSLLVAFIIAIYSLEYMHRSEERGDFYFWMLFFVGCMMGLVYSANLLLLFCFWELTSLCSWRLIGFWRRQNDIQAADRAFLVTFFGASLMLIAIVWIYLRYGNLNLSFLQGVHISNMLAGLFFIGMISKSAQLPLQSWLPDAAVAPTPVTALLHAAVLVKIGVYVFARLFGLVFVASPVFLNTAIMVSVLTILVASASALCEDNMKRILAYSTISQLGYILLALALNTDFSFRIALVYILAHSLAKAGLFLCAGIVEHKTHTKDINELGGLAKTMPTVAAAYLLCAFSIIGLPPFLGFWPKFFTILETINHGYIFAGIISVVGAIFTLLYLLRLYRHIFCGELKINVQEDKKSFMTLAVLVLGVLSLFLGLFFNFTINFIGKIK